MHKGCLGLIRIDPSISGDAGGHREGTHCSVWPRDALVEDRSAIKCTILPILRHPVKRLLQFDYLDRHC